MWAVVVVFSSFFFVSQTLKNYVESLTWRRVPSAQIAPRILEICKKEGLSIDRQSVEKIAESTHGDIRQILNFLQLFRKTNTAVGFDQVKQRMDTAGKDFDLGAFDVVPELFKPVPPAIPGSKGADWISERQNRYFVDSDIIPLFVAENYLHAKPHIQAALLSRSNDKLKRMAGAQSGAVADVLGLEVIAEAADSISCGDLLSDAMYSEQDYTLMPSHAILSTVYPAYLMRGGLSERLHFPALLGKQSTRNKNLRIAREFKTALSIDIHADSEEMAMFVMPQLRIELLQALQNDDVRTKKNKCRGARQRFRVRACDQAANRKRMAAHTPIPNLFDLCCSCFSLVSGCRCGGRDRTVGSFRIGQG